MSDTTDLYDTDIADFLGDNPLWRFEDRALVREFSAQDFNGAVIMLNDVALVAEAMDHHPDMLIYGWNKLRVTITTHSRGGLTNKDIEFANSIDKLGF